MFWDMLGTLLNVVGEQQKAQAETSAARSSASIALFNEQQTLNDGQIAVTQKRQQAAVAQGNLVANVGASGLSMAGSALDLLYSNAYQSELDAQYTKMSYQAKATSYGMQASLDKSRAGFAETAGYLNMASAALKGASKYIKSDGSDSVAGTTPFSLG